MPLRKNKRYIRVSGFESTLFTWNFMTDDVTLVFSIICSTIDYSLSHVSSLSFVRLSIIHCHTFRLNRLFDYRLFSVTHFVYLSSCLGVAKQRPDYIQNVCFLWTYQTADAGVGKMGHVKLYVETKCFGDGALLKS
jgi:hypothetical protein